MSEQQLLQLEKIYNTFLLVQTKGNDTLIMAEALKALNQIIEQLAATAVMRTDPVAAAEIKE